MVTEVRTPKPVYRVLVLDTDDTHWAATILIVFVIILLEDIAADIIDPSIGKLDRAAD